MVSSYILPVLSEMEVKLMKRGRQTMGHILNTTGQQSSCYEPDAATFINYDTIGLNLATRHRNMAFDS